MKLLLASGNQHKLREFRGLLADIAHVSLLSPADVGLSALEVVEDGDTFARNARIKAAAYAKASGLPVLADDSGIVVDHLGGAPGIYSARYAGPLADDQKNNDKLLAALHGVPKAARTARYRVALVYLEPGERPHEPLREHLIEATCEGHILSSPEGDGGFGYDPLFQPLGHRCTMAQLSPEEKAAIGHRGKAAREMAAWLRHHLAGQPQMT